MMEQKPKRKRRIVVLVDEDLHQRARMKSVETDTPLTQVLREALQKWVEEPQSLGHLAATVDRDGPSPLDEEF